MIQTTIQLRVLEAGEGMLLTNGETYSKMVYLGTTDDPSNWQEVPEKLTEPEDEA